MKSNNVVARNLVARIRSLRDGCHYERRSPKLDFCVVTSFDETFWRVMVSFWTECSRLSSYIDERPPTHGYQVTVDLIG
jgi:hypothetical protein